MHPVMFTIPGWAFKVIVPLLILWGCFSIVVSVNRSAPQPKKPDAKDGEKPAESSFTLPADSPFNALVSIGVGLGVFSFAAPISIVGEGPARVVSVLKQFANGAE